MGRPSNAELARRAALANPDTLAGAELPPEPIRETAAIDATNLSIADDVARINAMRAQMPFGSFDRKLAFPPIEGYAQHWFNDKPGRIDMALRAGWTHVADVGGKPRYLIGSGDGMRMYLLKIPQQFRDEDAAREQAKAATALNAVKKKPTGQTAGGESKPEPGAFYTPNASGDAATITRS